MTKSIETFFAAWAEQDATVRDKMIDDALSGSILYADPRTEAALTDATSVKGYVAQFSQMAPGMPVAAVNISRTLGFVRATVLFGAGEQSQTGQYIADLDADEKISRLVGFVGMGAPE